jgi:hypothetical protein
MSSDKKMPSLHSFEMVEKPAAVSAEPKVIEVVAMRPGFFKQIRRKVGDKFVVSDMSKVGEWMKCTDRDLEKKRQEMVLQKKRKAAGR